MSDLTKNVKPLDDFNWDEFENGTSAGISKEELDKAYDETLSKVADHQVVEGTVISVDKKEVVVNIGYKSDGIIPASEFRYNPDLKIGDKVEVYVESAEDKKGQLILSHKKARMSKSWDKVNEALEADAVIQGYIKCRTKGGMIVDVFGIEAFLPGSQIDVHPIRDYDQFVGKTMEFKVVRSSAMSLYLTRLLLSRRSRHRRRRLSVSLRRVRSSRVQLRISPLTVYSLTSVVLTDSSISQTCLGAVLTILTRWLSSTRRSMWLSSTSTTRSAASPSV